MEGGNQITLAAVLGNTQGHWPVSDQSCSCCCFLLVVVVLLLFCRAEMRCACVVGEEVQAKLELPADTTIGAVKAAVEGRMAGHPPAPIQRLVHGMRLLDDDEPLSGLLAPAEEEDEFSMDSDPAASGPANELTILLDMLPPLPVDKSLPAAIEAKLKAFAAEVVAVRHLLNQVGAGVSRPAQAAVGGDGAAADGTAAAEAAFQLETSSLREEIRAMEAEVLSMCAHNLTARKETVHSAIIEDGKVDLATMRSPWKASLLKLSRQMDVDWRSTLTNMATLLFLARFATPGPGQARIIQLLAVMMLVLQTRPARLASKVLLALAATNRGPMVDLLSTLLPTSHQVLLDAELDR